MVGRSGDPEEPPRGGRAADRLRQFIDEHFDPHERPEPLPEAVEQDHHGRPSFRVAGKIFATLWDESHMNVMLDEGGILTATQRDLGVYEEVWWGKKLAAARRAIRRANCRVGRVRKARSRRPSGRVLKQTPRPGKRLAVGTKVNLVVSRGPAG